MPSEPPSGPGPPEKTYVLQLLEGEKLLGSYPVGPTGLRIGRRADNDVVVKDKSVSRKHCRVFLDGNACKLADLGSSYGTTVNGKPVRSADLAPGDVVEFGSFRLKVVVEETRAALSTHRPAVTRMEVVEAERVMGNRYARLGLAAYWLVRRHPFWSLLITGLTLPLFVIGLAKFDPSILQSGALDNEYGRRFAAWVADRGTGLALVGRLEDKKAGEDEGKDSSKDGKGGAEGEDSSSKRAASEKGRKTLEDGPRPKLKLMEGIGSALGQLGRGLGQTSAMLVKPEPLDARAGPSQCARGRRPDGPCLTRAKMTDGSERMLIKWKPGAFHKDSWRKLPEEVLRALRDKSAYPEGYIDPEEEGLPKPPPTVLGMDEANAMFEAITGLDAAGTDRAGRTPWDQLIKDEKYAAAAMRCPTCPIASRVQSDRGVYYGETLK